MIRIKNGGNVTRGLQLIFSSRLCMRGGGEEVLENKANCVHISLLRRKDTDNGNDINYSSLRSHIHPPLGQVTYLIGMLCSTGMCALPDAEK